MGKAFENQDVLDMGPHGGRHTMNFSGQAQILPPAATADAIAAVMSYGQP